MNDSPMEQFRSEDSNQAEHVRSDQKITTKRGMNKNVLFVIVAGVLLGGVGLYFMAQQNSESQSQPDDEIIALEDEGIIASTSDTQLADVISNPVSRLNNRVYGYLLEGKQYSGYYNGIAFNTTPEERDGLEVPISAFCTGAIVEKRVGIGYGGILVQECVIDNINVNVVYGHLDLSSIKKEMGDDLGAGEFIGNLGDNESEETAGATKQLHFAIYRGDNEKADIRAYVTEAELSDWLDPADYMPGLK